MRYLRGFGRFWYDFIVGDDWKIAAVVVLVLLLGGVLVAQAVLSATALTLLLGALMLVAFAAAMVLDLRSSR
jgi:uncharacterized membrane protein HdeD (DUF308 family)